MALAGKSFVLLDFPAKQKLQLSKDIAALGGSVAYTVAPGVFAVLTTPAEYERKSSKIAAAEKHNILILDVDFLAAIARDAGRGRVFEFSYALNRPLDLLPPLLVSNPTSYLCKSIAATAARVAAIAAVAFEEPDTPSVSSLGDLASSDDASSAGGDAASDNGWAAQVEKEGGAEAVIDPSLPLWKRRLLQRQAEIKERQEREKAAKLEAEQARARAKHEERQALQQETKEEARRKKEEAEEAKRLKAAARKTSKKAEVFAKRKKMEAERRAVREGEEEARQAALQAKRQEIIDKKIAQLTEIAKKIVERELHKDEFEAKQKEYLAQKEEKRKKRHDENQRKLFVGNVIVEDIVHASKKLTGERDEEKFTTLLTGRTEAILEVFKRFGKIECVLPFWEKKHAFIMYSTEAEARAAYTALKDYEKRKLYAEETRKALSKAKKPQLFAHKPNYYVRWNYNKTAKTKWGKGKKKDEEEGKEKKEKEEKSDKSEKKEERSEEAKKDADEAKGEDSAGAAGTEETEPIAPAADKKSKKAAAKAKAKAKKGAAKDAKKDKPKPPKGAAPAPVAPAAAAAPAGSADWETGGGGGGEWVVDGTPEPPPECAINTWVSTRESREALTATLPEKNAAVFAAVEPNGFLVGGRALLYYENGENHHEPTLKHTFPDTPEGLLCAAATAECAVVVAGFESGHIMVWNGTADTAPATLPAGAPVRSIGVHGNLIAAALDDHSLQFWRPDGEFVASQNAPHGDARFGVLWNHALAERLSVVTFGGDGHVCHWGGNDKPRRTARYKVSDQPLTCAAISPDGSLLTVGDKSTVYVIDANEHKVLYPFALDDEALSVSYSATRYWLCVGTKKGARIVDLESKKVVHERPVKDARWAHLANGGKDTIYANRAGSVQVHAVKGDCV